MKYIFVGDIHGKVEQVERALEKEGKKIFVGDFMDSFTRSVTDHQRCFELVLAAIRAGEAEAIFGNHELSYLMPMHRCSGYTVANDFVMKSLRDDVLGLFKPHIMVTPEFLVTHAGLTRQIWDREHMSLDDLDHKLLDWWPDKKSPAHHIGHHRGGGNPQGGTFWCDFNAEFQPVPGLTQVFGHTAGGGIRQVEQSFCIDCLDFEHSFLEMEI